MINKRLAGRLTLVAVWLVAAACASTTPAPSASPPAAPPPTATVAAPTQPPVATQTAATQPALSTPSPSPIKALTTPPLATPTMAAMPTSTPALPAGQVLSISQIIALSFIDPKQGWLLAAGPCVEQVCATTMRHTHDGGQTWTGIPAPAAPALFFPTVFPRQAGDPAGVSSMA